MKLSRLITCSVVLAVASMARADIVVELVADDSANAANPAGYYDAGETVAVHVMLSQSPAANDQLLRMVQLDVSGTDAVLRPTMANTWAFGADRHYFEAGDLPGRSDIYSATYYGDPTLPDLGPAGGYQLLLPAASAVEAAVIEVTMPDVEGSYLVDVLSPGSDVNLGGKVIFGFGLQGPEGPVAIMTANDGTMTGGQVPLMIGVPACGLTDSVPAHDSTLWRNGGNYIAATFECDLPALSEPGVCPVLIQEMLPGGDFGDNLSEGFTCAVEGDTLSITEDGSVLVHETWYAIRSTGDWAGVEPFAIHYQLVVGDANADGRSLPNDLSLINTQVPNLSVAADSRFDINGDHRVLPNDLSIANSFIPSFGVAKPAGH